MDEEGALEGVRDGCCLVLSCLVLCCIVLYYIVLFSYVVAPTFQSIKFQVVSRILEPLREFLHNEVVASRDVCHPVSFIGDQRMHPKLEE